MRISKLLKELNLSFDSLKLYEPYLDVKIESIDQELSDLTRLKILSIQNNTKIQEEIDSQNSWTNKIDLSQFEKPKRVRKAREKIALNKFEKFIGNIDWYYNHATQDEYGFVKNRELGGVYFRGDVVIGIRPERLRENEQVIFELRSRDLHSKRKRATKLYRVEEETDILFLISNSLSSYLDFLNYALVLATKDNFVLKEPQKNEITAIFNRFLNKSDNPVDFSKALKVLNLIENLELKLNTTAFYKTLNSSEKFALFCNTNYTISIDDIKENLIKYVLEDSQDNYAKLEKLKPEEKKNLLEIVYNRILEGAKVKSTINLLGYLNTYININFNKFPPEILLKLWTANKLDFFPLEAIYKHILECNETILYQKKENQPYKWIEIDLDNIFNNLSEEENRELFFRCLYEIEEIKEVSIFQDILFFVNKTKFEELQEEFHTIIFNKSSEFIKLYLFVEDYTDEIDFHNSVIYTGFLSSEQQKVFFKKVLMLIETNVLNVNLEDLSKIIVYDYQENVLAKRIDGVGLDFTLSIILRIANDLKNNTITNQQTMFEIIANQIKTPQDFLEINGFFSECTGRTISEAVFTEVDGERQVDYITKKTDFKPRFSNFCDGRKAIHKTTNKPVLSTNEQFEFWWCENSPCFEICRCKTIPENWRNYTLEDVLRILKVPFSQYQYEVVLGVINKVNRFLEHLKCTSCKTILRPKGNSNYSFYRVSEFSCTNESCANPDKDVYLNHCLNGKCLDIIDSRTTVKCKPKSLENVDNTDNCGWYICNNCLSCCSSEKLLARKYNKEKFGGNYNCHVRGHRDLGIICCPKCGVETEEKAINLKKYNETLDWFKSKIGTVAIEKYGQRDDGKWWFRWRQGNIDRDTFRNTLLQLKNNGFQVPNYNTSDDVQFISESFNKLNTIPNSFECGNCNHIIDLADKEVFDVSRVRAVKSFHNKIFPTPENRN
tara:strand:- start:1184 stop:4030 length:2847 start_codon:yes stop_codon:yes gene_type:complete